MRRIFVGEFFTVALIAGTEKVWRREGGVSRFSVERFISHSAENFPYGRPLLLHKFRVLKTFGSEWGSIKTFCRKVFVSQCRKFPEGNPLLSHFFPVAKKFGFEGRGEYQDFPSKIYVSQCGKFSLGNHLLLQ